jgi:hypothetical protein
MPPTETQRSPTVATFTHSVARPIGLAIAALALLLPFIAEPALANKFETIGGGFSGSSGFKRSWLTLFFVITGGISVLLGVLAIVTPHTNASFLNYGNWKQSALVLFSLAGVFFLMAVLI